MDPSLLVRKQALHSITSILQNYPSNDTIQSQWVDGVLPLVFDKEASIQQKCLELLQKMLLDPITDQVKHHSQGL